MPARGPEVLDRGTSGGVVGVLQNAVANDEIEPSRRTPCRDVGLFVAVRRARVVTHVGGHDRHLRVVCAVPVAPVARTSTDVEK